MNIDSNDRGFFRANPRLSSWCQLATPAEIDGMRTHGISVQRSLATDFVHCIARLHGQNIERIFIAIGLLGDMDEQHCRQALHDADCILGAQVERLAQ